MGLVDVAVIDEIQMLQDSQRGWAWTRALLGVVAKEVHVCGEAAAIPLVQNLLATAGEIVEVCSKYCFRYLHLLLLVFWSNAGST